MNNILQEITWNEVDSSNISQIAYHEDTQQIVVEFKDGAIWGYSGCDLPLFERFRIAPSIGKFFHANIKSRSAERLN